MIVAEPLASALDVTGRIRYTRSMANATAAKLRRRVTEAAESALAENEYVSPVDVLVGIRWLTPSALDMWKQGRTPYLETVAQVDASRLAEAMDEFRAWAETRGLQPVETEYVARTRRRPQLRFTEAGDPSRESFYRTHWFSPDLSQRQRERLLEKTAQPPDLVVIEPRKDFVCTGCGGSGAFLIMDGPGPWCMTCSEMDHLWFLPAGDAALTRRAKKLSGLSAVVVRWSRTRKRYERQGILVEEDALLQAEAELQAEQG